MQGDNPCYLFSHGRQYKRKYLRNPLARMLLKIKGERVVI